MGANQTKTSPSIVDVKDSAPYTAEDPYVLKKDFNDNLSSLKLAYDTKFNDYFTKDEVKDMFALKSALTNYQPKGDYAFKDDLAAYQPVGDYATQSQLLDYQPYGDYVIRMDLADYQPKGNYVLQDQLNNYLLTSRYNSEILPINDFVNKLKGNSAFTRLYRV